MKDRHIITNEKESENKRHDWVHTENNDIEHNPDHYNNTQLPLHDIGDILNLDWRYISDEDISNGAGSRYGNQLETGNYVGRVINQHVAFYCGSCWTLGSSHALSDRIAIQEVASGNKKITDAQLDRRYFSVQHILDNYEDADHTVGSCMTGGSAHLFFVMLNKLGVYIPDSLNPYTAQSREYGFNKSSWANV